MLVTPFRQVSKTGHVDICLSIFPKFCVNQAITMHALWDLARLTSSRDQMDF